MGVVLYTIGMCLVVQVVVMGCWVVVVVVVGCFKVYLLVGCCRARLGWAVGLLLLEVEER